VEETIVDATAKLREAMWTLKERGRDTQFCAECRRLAGARTSGR
jgi:hypothetical protein